MFAAATERTHFGDFPLLNSTTITMTIIAIITVITSTIITIPTFVTIITIITTTTITTTLITTIIGQGPFPSVPSTWPTCALLRPT